LKLGNYENFVALSRYARWREEDGRRETWNETVKRYFDFFEKKLDNKQFTKLRKELEEAVFNLEVLPSMRCMMTAGPALERDNVAGYNCSYVAVDNPKVFDEIMYILMCGTGVGFSVERQYINKLPEVAEELYDSQTCISVPDSRVGWATSFRELIQLLYAGKIPRWDLSRLRPAGAVLKTFGGRSSGPEPLDELFKFTVELFQKSAGRRLNSLECHDLVCKVADVIVVGGVRRSALISLSNLTDERMRSAKSGQWWEATPHRRLANNSVAYTEHPDIGIFLKEWVSLYESKSGERGIFNRVASREQAGRSGRRDTEADFGTNPCSEIILRSKQFCNLSEIVVRPEDSLDSLRRKARLATILGTIQATLTDFRYLSKIWETNTKEERLLGVSLTGIMDHKLLSGAKKDKDNFDYNFELSNWLKELKNECINTNKEWAKILDIPQSVAITCVKPSGTVSQLVNSASGIHARHSPYYIRTVRNDNKDPITKFLIDQGVHAEPDVMSPTTTVFSFLVKSPEKAVFRNDRTAIEQLELWKLYQEHWCEHKPSITVTYRESEFMEVGAWCYRNFSILSGVSFLPHIDHIYKQAPYQEITKEKYDELCDKMTKEIDWSKLADYEKTDETKGSHELACVSGACEI
jgi:ribonucleoside-triphosphate reductase (thioredoxin)